MNTLCNPGCYFLYDHALKISPIRTYFDAGANEGGFSATAPTDMFIHAFEPVPSMFLKLCLRLTGRGHAKLNNVALSDRSELVKGMTVVNAWTLAVPEGCSIERVPEFKDVTFDVQMTTLDEYCIAHNARIGVLKLDVDGYEPKVLYGGANVIKRDRPWIYCELSYLPRLLNISIIKFVKFIVFDLNYLIVSVDGRTILSDPDEIIDFYYPWNTSLDAMLVPCECRNHIPAQ